MNPLVPAGTDIVWAALVTLHALLALAALITLALSHDRKGWIGTALFIVLVPFIGPVVALIAARRSRMGGVRVDSAASARRPDRRTTPGVPPCRSRRDLRLVSRLR